MSFFDITAATYSTTVGRMNVMTHIYMVIPSALVPALIVILIVTIILWVIRKRYAVRESFNFSKRFYNVSKEMLHYRRKCFL